MDHRCEWCGYRLVTWMNGLSPITRAMMVGGYADTSFYL